MSAATSVENWVRISAKNAAAVRFEPLSEETINFVEAVAAVSGVPCSLIANKFDFKCVIDRGDCHVS
ncbi:MAG: hypothetical protein OXE84_03455 [Rhodobacteraceae bacterium]|nr:hypothetical protein [Paracoccaceae bacterium]